MEALPKRFAGTDNNLRFVVTGVSIPNPVLLLSLLGSVILWVFLLVGKIKARNKRSSI